MSDETNQNQDFEFNLENDFKQDPLIPNGNYYGNIIEVSIDNEKACIVWKVALDGNGGYKSDGETPVDGSHVFFRNYLPKKGDELEKTANGSSTKFQSKVNMLKKFADDMKVNMNTMRDIRDAIDGTEWIGKAVLLTVKIDEFPKGSGQYKSDIQKMVAAE